MYASFWCARKTSGEVAQGYSYDVSDDSVEATGPAITDYRLNVRVAVLRRTQSRQVEGVDERLSANINANLYSAKLKDCLKLSRESIVAAPSTYSLVKEREMNEY